MVRAKKKRKEMTKFLFLLSPNLVISYYIYQIRHLIIISALLTKKKGARRDRLRQFEIYPNPTVRKTPKKSLSNARNARPILPLNKKESFLPPLKQNKTKISLIKSNEKTKLCIILF